MPPRRGAALFFVFFGMPCRCREDKTGAAAPRPPRCCGGVGDQSPRRFFPSGGKSCRAREEKSAARGAGEDGRLRRCEPGTAENAAAVQSRRPAAVGEWETKGPPKIFLSGGCVMPGAGRKKRRLWGGGGWSALCRTMRKNPPKRRPVPLRPAGGKGAVRAQGALLGDWGALPPILSDAACAAVFPEMGCSAQRPGSSERPVR